MTQLTYQIPQSGNPNSTEDPKIATALTQLQTVINSELTSDNMPTVLACAVTQPTRAIGTAYQPNVTRPTHVNAIISMGSTGSPSYTASCVAKIDPTSSPATEVDAGYLSTNADPFFITFGLKFIVPAGYYYELTTPAIGTLTGLLVTETTL